MNSVVNRINGNDHVDTPSYSGTIHATRHSTNKPLKEKLVPDIGCTIPCIPETVARSHSLKITELDSDEPDCQAYSGSSLTLTGQTTFWVDIDGLPNRRYVKVLVVRGGTQEILLSWQILKKWGVIGDTFPFPPNKSKEYNRQVSSRHSDDTLDVSSHRRKVKPNTKLASKRKNLLKEFSDVFK